MLYLNELNNRKTQTIEVHEVVRFGRHLRRSRRIALLQEQWKGQARAPNIVLWTATPDLNYPVYFLKVYEDA